MAGDRDCRVLHLRTLRRHLRESAQRRGGDGRLWIDRADPRVLIGIQLLGCIHGGPAEGVTLTLRKDAKPGCCKYIGAVLRIEAANQTLVYRVTECVPWYYGYIAEWPD